jgi:peroxiredoxin
MALLETPEKDTGFKISDFSLKGVDDQMYSFDDVKGEKGTVIMFICNHCPYVKAIIHRLVDDCRFLQEKGIGCVAIMPNDVASYPADSFDNMKIFAKENGFTFPYLIDENQDVAQNYGAICTPDIYGFNAEGYLQYRGRVDSSGPNEADGDTVREMRNAMLQIAETNIGPTEQFPSMGCSIKWKES